MERPRAASQASAAGDEELDEPLPLIRVRCLLIAQPYRACPTSQNSQRPLGTTATTTTHAHARARARALSLSHTQRIYIYIYIYICTTHVVCAGYRRCQHLCAHKVFGWLGSVVWCTCLCTAARTCRSQCSYSTGVRFCAVLHVHPGPLPLDPAGMAYTANTPA